MSGSAGFAASLALHERLFQLFLRSYYNANLATPKLVVSAAGVVSDIFLSLPEIRFRGAPTSGMHFELSGWGPFTMSLGGPPATRRVKLRVLVRAQAKGEATGGALKLSVDTAALEVLTLSIDPYTGGLFSPAEITHLQSPSFNTALIEALGRIFAQINLLLPPFSLEFIGSLASDPTLLAKLAYGPEVLLVGLDVDNEELSTHGDPGGLADETRGNDVGVWIGRRAVEPAFSDVRTSLEEQILEAGAELDTFRLVPDEGWLALSGRAAKSGARVVFSLKAVPRLIRPGYVVNWREELGENFSYVVPDREELWFETVDITVDIQRPWWAVLAELFVGVLTLGIGFFVIEGLVAMIRGNIVNQADNNEAARGQRNRSFTLIGVTRPVIQLRLEEFESHSRGVYSGVRIRAGYWWYAEIDGPPSLPADEALTSSVRYTLKLPPDVLEPDPELQVAWTVRRRDTNAVVLATVDRAQGNLSVTIDNSIVPFLEVGSIDIEVRLFRTLGAQADNLFSGSRVLRISDYVDRSHPFVRWSHQAVVPIVRVEPDGSHTIITQAAVGRNSAIHRTAIPGRCRMLRNYSLQRVLPKDGPPFALEYLDALPFPMEEIVANRAVLCDYCFFGGPTKTDPLI